jgi:serine/threonine-protein kinase
MATVYLARDLKHNRHVALKVLKPELAAVVGAERFLAEIETTANLQHPNILPLYDSGEADTFLYYVMPYVEGESLRDRLDAEKQLPVDEAVKIATAVAHALDFAHTRGVVHRDIKPANILFQGGQPVVGDFGIALAVGAGGAARLTETGLSVGTPYYMSPEQATGDQQVGARSDIYSLGCVLYEMLVGDPPYTGSTAQAVLGQIISGKPVTATEKRPAVPANVDGVIRKALEKMPADRFATASDFATAVADPAFRYGETGAAGAPSRSSRSLVAGLTATVLVLAVALAWALTQRDGAEPQTATWTDFAPTEPFVQHPRGDGVGFALAPDGRQVVYQGEDEDGERVLWRRSLSSLEPVLIAGTEGGFSPAVDPDARTVAFVVPPLVKTVPLDGGPPVTIAEGRDPTWGDDGSLYFIRDKTVYRLPPEGGDPRAWTTPGVEDLLTPQALPGGQGLLLTVRVSVPEFSRIAVVGPEGGEVREILDGTGAGYVQSGHIVYTTFDGTLWAAPFDLTTFEVGQPVTLWGDVSVHGSSYTRFAVSASGSLLYQRPAPSRPRETVWVDRDGSFEPLGPDWSHSLGAPVLAPDGSAVVFEWRGDVWVRRFDGTPALQLTFDGSGGRRPSWTPGSDSIMYRERSERGEEGLHTRRADGSGQPVLTHTDAREVITARWTPDREWLVYRTNANLSGSADILAIRVGRDSVPTPVVASPAADLAPALSRDGRWMAYHSDESGRTEVYVVPFPEGEVGGKWKISAEGGITPIWSHDGRELFYASDEGFVAVPVQTEPSFASGAPRILFPLDDFATFVLYPEYDVAGPEPGGGAGRTHPSVGRPCP